MNIDFFHNFLGHRLFWLELENNPIRIDGHFDQSNDTPLLRKAFQVNLANFARLFLSIQFNSILFHAIQCNSNEKWKKARKKLHISFNMKQKTRVLYITKKTLTTNLFASLNCSCVGHNLACCLVSTNKILVSFFLSCPVDCFACAIATAIT